MWPLKNNNYKHMKSFIVLVVICCCITNVLYAQQPFDVLVVYDSKTEHTKSMAEYVRIGAASVKGIHVIVKNIKETNHQDLAKANAIILGTPVHNANASSDMLAFIENWPFENNSLKNKLGAVFVTAGGISAGEELVQSNLIHAMLIFGMVIIGGDEWTSAFGASAITNEPPFKTDAKNVLQPFQLKAIALGKRVAEATIRWNKTN
jgi:NAD(P)H dehydrogenase (quinone)